MMWSGIPERLRVTFMDHSCPQRSAAMMTGYSLQRAEKCDNVPRGKEVMPHS